MDIARQRRAVLRGGAAVATLATAAGCGGAPTAPVDARPVTLPRAARAATGLPARAVLVEDRGRRLVRLDLATGARRVLLRSRAVRGGDVGLDAPAIAPDGRRLAVVSAVGASDYRTISTILVVPIGGGRARRVPGVRLVNADQLAPVWTPDGRALALPRDAGHDAVDLVDVRTGRRRPLLRGSARGPVAFAPDGKAYAFSGPGGLWLRRAGHAPRLVAPDARSPAWSPDGRRLAYLSTRDRHGRISFGDAGSGDAAELYVAGADGARPRRLTDTTAEEEGPPRWTTDGRAIVALRFAPGPGVTAHAYDPARPRCALPLARPLAAHAAGEDPDAWDLRAPLAAAAGRRC